MESKTWQEADRKQIVMRTPKVITKKELVKMLDGMPDDAKVAIRSSLVISGVECVKYDKFYDLIILSDDGNI